MVYVLCPVLVAFSPDSTLLASGADDNTIKLWNLQTDDVKVLTGHTGGVCSVAFSPDGSLLASGSTDKTIRLWNVQTNDKPNILECPDWVSAVAFSPDGRLLASGGLDGNIIVWKISTRKMIGVPVPTNKIINALAFSPDGTLLVTGSPGGADLWNVRTGRKICSHETSEACSVAFSPKNSELLATGSLGGFDLQLWWAVPK